MDVQKILYNQFKQGSFCDVTLKVHDGQIPAHRSVLAAKSDYFGVMFEAEFKEKTQMEIDLSKTFSSVACLKCVIDFLYGDELNISADNVAELLRLGEQLLVPDITDSCVTFLFTNLCEESCLRTWVLAEAGGSQPIPELVDLCKKIAIRFTDSVLEDANNVSPAQLAYFLDCGLAKDCNKKELLTFLQNYCQNSENTDDILQRFLTKLQSETDKDPNSTEDKEVQELVATEEEEDPTDLEECILLNGDNSFYRPRIKKWFNFPILAARTQVVVSGIGKKKNYSLLHVQIGSSEYRLVNLLNAIDCIIPEIPHIKKECFADRIHRRTFIYFVHKNELHIVYSSKLEYDPLSKDDSKPLNVVYIQQFDIAQWKWKFSFALYESTSEEITALCVAQFKNITHILLGFKSHFMILLLNQMSGKVEQKAVQETETLNIRTGTMQCFSTQTGHMYIIFEKEGQKIAKRANSPKLCYLSVFSYQHDDYLPNIDNLMLSLPCKGKTNEYVACSDCKLYLKCFGHGGKPSHFFSFDLKTRDYFQLPDFPKGNQKSGFYCNKLPKFALSRASELQTSCGCTEQEVRSALKTYNKRVNRERKAAMTGNGKVQGAEATIKEKKKRKRNKNKYL